MLAQVQDGTPNFHTRRGPQAGGHQGPAIILPKGPDLFPSSCQTKCLRIACVRSLEGRREGSPKTHQKTKTKLSSATPNRDKTFHCQRKRRSIPPAMSKQNQHLTHATPAKACDNNTQTILNNIVLWQRWPTCRRGWRH